MDWDWIYIFNLIVGTGALTLPKAFHDVGYVAGPIIAGVFAFISYITATFVIESISNANALMKNNENRAEPAPPAVSGAESASPILSPEQLEAGRVHSAPPNSSSDPSTLRHRNPTPPKLQADDVPSLPLDQNDTTEDILETGIIFLIYFLKKQRSLILAHLKEFLSIH